MVAGSASTSPSCRRASDWIRGEASARESCDESVAFSARSFERCCVALSSWRLRRSTARFTNTTPASTIALITIQAIAPCGRLRRFALARGFAAVFGFGFAAVRVRVRGAGRRDGFREPARHALIPTRSRADCERGLRATSAGDGRIARRGIARNVGCAPHTQSGKSGGHVQPCSCVAQEALHDPVLERVERDHREPAARAQDLERRRQRALERAELVVDLDPQRLEDALGRMALAEARRRRDRLLDRLDEVAGALERLLGAAADDRARDLAREALLAVAAEDVGELALVGLVDELARGQLRGGVHAHVERRVGGVREAALGPVELHRRDAEVEQDRVGADAVRRELAEHGRELAARGAAS